jgi:hypothetical protein
MLAIGGSLATIPSAYAFDMGDMMSPNKWFGGKNKDRYYDDYYYDRYGPYGYGGGPYGWGGPYGGYGPYGYGYPGYGYGAPGYYPQQQQSSEPPPPPLPQ